MLYSSSYQTFFSDVPLRCTPFTSDVPLSTHSFYTQVTPSSTKLFQLGKRGLTQSCASQCLILNFVPGKHFQISNSLNLLQMLMTHNYIYVVS